MMGVETIGNYNIRKIGDDKYAVAVNNGNMGAFVTDKKGLEEFKAKLKAQPAADECCGKTAKTPKKKSVWKAIASAFLPGLGQAIDGRWKDGFKDYATAAGCVAAGTAAGLAGYMSFVKAVEKGLKTPMGFYAGMAAAALAGVGLIATRIHSAKDAYNGGKQ